MDTTTKTPKACIGDMFPSVFSRNADVRLCSQPIRLRTARQGLPR